MISITLPSLDQDAALRTIEMLWFRTRGPYEVLLVGQFEIDLPHVISIPEGDARGCAYAHHVAAQHARGDYLLAFADDHELVDGWDEIALAEFVDRRGNFIPFALGLRGVHSGHVGTDFGMYYPYFPLMTRADV